MHLVQSLTTDLILTNRIISLCITINIICLGKILANEIKCQGKVIGGACGQARSGFKSQTHLCCAGLTLRINEKKNMFRAVLKTLKHAS